MISTLGDIRIDKSLKIGYSYILSFWYRHKDINIPTPKDGKNSENYKNINGIGYKIGGSAVKKTYMAAIILTWIVTLSGVGIICKEVFFADSPTIEALLGVDITIGFFILGILITIGINLIGVVSKMSGQLENLSKK